MKNLLKRGLALLIILMILVSSISISSFAAVSKPQISNTGERGEICTTFNGTTAPEYYTGTYSYANLSTMSSSELKSALSKLMTSTHKTQSSYDDCRDYGYYTDCENGNTKYVCTIYTSYYVDSNGWVSGWNREHVWPQSLGGGNTSGGGADLHHIRPSESGVNSSRGNKKYGETDNSNPVTSSNSGLLGGYSSGNYFEPLDNTKGDVARICLYVYVRWGSSWGADSITDVFQNVDTLLEWCALDPVDTWEMERNDVIESVQGNRNVFIDYPELAWKIFGKSVPSNLVSPSDGADNGTVGGGNEGGTTPEEPTDPTPEVPGGDVDVDGDKVVFELGSNGNATHSDGSEVTSYTETNGSYTLEIGSCTKVYKNARDQLGNSALKIGTGSGAASFSFTAPDDVKAVVIKIAGYKDNAAKLTINGQSYTVSTSSNKGEYTDIEIDTTTNKTVTVETVSGGYRAMINSITYVITASGGGEGGSTPDVPVDPTPDVPVDPTPDAPVDPTPDVPVDPNPNPGEDVGGDDGGDTPTATENVVFELGENGTASHSDGSSATGYSETVGGYTLNITSGVKMYKGARDEKGNSAIKLGTSSAVGSFSFTVPDDINSVIIKVAQYKANATEVSVNGTSYTIRTSSNSGEYTEIIVDTTTNKTVTVATTSSGKRAMVDSITYVVPTPESGVEHNYNEHGYCKDCDVSFRTASLILSDDLAMRYGVEVMNDDLLALGTLKMVFTFGGNTYVVTEYAISGEYYVFTFNGISPDEMTVIITADFYIGDEIVATFSDYSVEKNLLSIREKNSTDTTLVQLVNDVLIYGSAAQIYTGNNTSDLAGADATGVTASTDVPTDGMLVDGNESTIMYIKSMGVHFDCVNNVYIKIYVSNPALFGSLVVDDVTYTLSDMEALGEGVYRLDFASIGPCEFDDLMLVTLIGADTVEYTTAIYSVNCYAAYMYNGGAAEGSAMYDLALALYRYGKSAVEYSKAHA